MERKIVKFSVQNIRTGLSKLLTTSGDEDFENFFSKKLKKTSHTFFPSDFQPTTSAELVKLNFLCSTEHSEETSFLETVNYLTFFGPGTKNL